MKNIASWVMYLGFRKISASKRTSTLTAWFAVSHHAFHRGDRILRQAQDALRRNCENLKTLTELQIADCQQPICNLQSDVAAHPEQSDVQFVASSQDALVAQSQGRSHALRSSAKRHYATQTLLAVLILLALAGCASVQPAAPRAATDWFAQPVRALPSTIAPDDAHWQAAIPAFFPLHEGSHGPLTPHVVELRALYDAQQIAFRARWNGAAFKTETPFFTLFWRKDDLPAQRGECHTACHNSFGDGQGGLKQMIASVVPAGREAPMPANLQWKDGLWTLVWRRPLVSDEATDVQFNDLSQRYPVRAKIWRAPSDLPADAPAFVTERYALRFK